MAVLKLDILKNSNGDMPALYRGASSMIGNQYSNVCNAFKFKMHGATYEQESDIDYIIEQQIKWLLRLLSNYSNTSWCFEPDNKLNKNINWMDNVEMFLFSAGIDNLSYLMELKDKKVLGAINEGELFKIFKAKTLKERVEEFGFYEVHWVKKAVNELFVRLDSQKQYNELVDTIIHTFGSQIYTIIFEHIHEERSDCTELYSKWYGYKKAIELPVNDISEDFPKSQVFFSRIYEETGTLNNGNGSLGIGSIWASLRRANGFFSIRKLLPKFGIFEHFAWSQSISFEEAKVIHDKTDKKSREITACALFNLYLEEIDKGIEIRDFYKTTKNKRKKKIEFICFEWERFKESGYDSEVLGLNSITKNIKNKTKSFYLPKVKALNAKFYVKSWDEKKGLSRQEQIEKIAKAMPPLLHLMILCQWVGELTDDVKELDDYLNKYVLNVLEERVNEYTLGPVVYGTDGSVNSETLNVPGDVEKQIKQIDVERVRLKIIKMLIGHHNGFGDSKLLFWLKGKDLLLPLLNCVRNQRMFSTNTQKKGHSKLVKHVFEQVDLFGSVEELPVDVWLALDGAKLLKKYCEHKQLNFWNLSVVKSGVYFINQVQKRTFYGAKVLEKLWQKAEDKSFVFENLPTNHFLFSRQSLLENKKYVDWLISNINEYEASADKEKQSVARAQKEALLYWVKRQMQKAKELSIVALKVDFFKNYAKELYQEALSEENYEGAKWLKELFEKNGKTIGELRDLDFDASISLKERFVECLKNQEYKELQVLIDEIEEMSLLSWGCNLSSVEQEKRRISFVQKCLGVAFSSAQSGSVEWCSAYEPSNRIDILKEAALPGVASRLYVMLLEYQNSVSKYKEDSFVYDKDVLIYYFFKIATMVTAQDPKTQKYNKSSSLMNWLVSKGNVAAGNLSIMLDLDYISELFGRLNVPVTMQWVYEADDTTMGHLILNHIIHEHPQCLWVSAYSDLPNYLLDSFWTWYPALDEKFVLENFEDSYEKSLTGMYDKSTQESEGFWLQNVKRVLDFDLWLFSKIDFSMETVLVSLNEQSRHSGALAVLLRLILEKQSEYFEVAVKELTLESNNPSKQKEFIEEYEDYNIKGIYFNELKRTAHSLSNNFWYNALSNIDEASAVKSFVKKEQEKIKNRLYCKINEPMNVPKIAENCYDTLLAVNVLKEMNYVFVNKEPFNEMGTVPVMLAKTFNLIPYDFWISDIGEQSLIGIIKKRKYVLYNGVFSAIKNKIEQSDLNEKEKLECEKAWFLKMEKILKSINKQVTLARLNDEHNNGNKKILSWIESQKNYWHLVGQLDTVKEPRDKESRAVKKSFL